MITEDIAHELDNTIAWRREKAEQFPHDARNQAAIEICERLKTQTVGAAASARLADLEHDYLDEVAKMVEVETFDESLPVSHDETYRSIGFGFNPKHIDELVALLCKDYEAAIQRLRISTASDD